MGCFKMIKKRRSNRLKHYDYAANGAYFVTICTHNRECLFGEIVDGEMVLHRSGKIVVDEWLRTAEIRNEIELDEWVVMPNHFHAIVFIVNPCRGDRPVAPTMPCGPKPKFIGSLMAGFKSSVTKRINALRNTSGQPVWQRNYHDHIIRNETDLDRVCEYIQNNPLEWELDENNPVQVGTRHAVPLRVNNQSENILCGESSCTN